MSISYVKEYFDMFSKSWNLLKPYDNMLKKTLQKNVFHSMLISMPAKSSFEYREGSRRSLSHLGTQKTLGHFGTQRAV